MSTPLYTDAQTELIQSTTDYGQFKFDPVNRPIDHGHLEKLYDRVSEKNLLHLFPILVSVDGRVLDGQHRLKVAEALSCPVYYIVSPDMSIEDVPATTHTIRKWRKEDYMHYWCSVGKSEYLKLRAFQKKYSFLSLAQCITLCNRSDDMKRRDAFPTGSYVCNNMDFAEQVAMHLLDWRDVGVEFYAEKSFVNAVSNLARNPNYDHAKMMEKMKYLSLKVVKCPDMPTYIQMFDGLYNHRNRSRIEIRVMKG